MQLTVFVQQIPREGTNGDRATRRELYYDYAIHVLRDNEIPSDATKVHHFGGYDNFAGSIERAGIVRDGAIAWSKNLAKRLGCDWAVASHGRVFAFASRTLITAPHYEAAEAEFEAMKADGVIYFGCEEVK